MYFLHLSQEIQEIAKRMLVDRGQVESLIKLLVDYRRSNCAADGGSAAFEEDAFVSGSSSGSSSVALTTRKTNYSLLYLENLSSESEIKKKIMFISLNLASDANVSYFVQKQRREFYEKTKRKVNLLF
jgi:hypothetical protein